MAARAAGLAPPPQSVHPDTRDLDSLASSCAHGRALGFLGRAAIHPRQLPVIDALTSPNPEEIEEAEQIVKAAATTRAPRLSRTATSSTRRWSRRPAEPCP